jgi:hypothetical protein
MINWLIKVLIGYPTACIVIGCRRIKWALQKDIDIPEDPKPEEDRTFDRRTMSEQEEIVHAVSGGNFKTLLDLRTISMQEMRQHNIEHRKRMDEMASSFMEKALDNACEGDSKDEN